MQTDGNLVEYVGSHPLWASNTWNVGTGSYNAVVQPDGNLVVYQKNGQIGQSTLATWASGTYGKGTAPYQLTVQDDGNVVLSDAKNTTLWATGTYAGSPANPNPPAATPPSSVSSTVGGFTTLTSPNGQYTFKMQIDGNLVEYAGTTPLWASNTWNHGTGPYSAIMQPDGNLVVYQQNGKPGQSSLATWASGTYGKGSAPYQLTVQNDGNVVISDATNTLIWATNAQPTAPSNPPPPSSPTPPASAKADVAMTAFLGTFYNGNGYFYDDSTKSSSTTFWKEAEMMEIVIDAYNRTKSSNYQTLATTLFNGFVSSNGSSWSYNSYNDDIMWMVLYSLRLYAITGNSTQLADAKANFDYVYNNYWDSDLGGGIWWTTARQSKNTCVNAPAAIAAYLLYKSTNDSSYLQKSEALYAWIKTNLFTPSGLVGDHLNADASVANWPSTYNSGTFIGAANYLYQQTGSVQYLNDANLAAGYMKNSYSVNGILPQEYQTSDNLGFKGIFARWMGKFISDNNLGSTYNAWMQQNANAAWNERRSDNIMWSKFDQPTPSGTLTSFECSSAVSFLQNTPAQ